MTRNQTLDVSRLCRLSVPAVSVAIGLVYLVAGWLGDNLDFGIVGLDVMTAFAVAMRVSRRWSETVAGLLDRRDERINEIDLRATAVAGVAVIVAVIVAFVVETARDQDGLPYAWLGAVAGVAYAGTVVVQRVRGEEHRGQ